jgi:hypothetical protein
MRTLGIAVHLPTKARPAARCVVLDVTDASVALVEAFELASIRAPVPEQLRDMAVAARSRAQSLAVGAVWVRRADVPPRPSKAEGPKVRLLCEGAVTACVHEVVASVAVGDGKEIGATLGMSKLQADRRGSDLVSGGGGEAAAAALAAARRFGDA